MWVRSLARLSGLRIQRCYKLQCRSQTWLGSGVAVAVVWASSYRSHSTPSLGTSICRRCGPKRKKQNKQTNKVRLLGLRRWPGGCRSDPSRPKRTSWKCPGRWGRRLSVFLCGIFFFFLTLKIRARDLGFTCPETLLGPRSLSRQGFLWVARRPASVSPFARHPLTWFCQPRARPTLPLHPPARALRSSTLPGTW